MKKITLVIFAFLLGIVLVSCEETTDPIVDPDTGNIEIKSTPAGAKIILDGEDTQQVTPFIFTLKDVGTYTVTLQLDGYSDTTVTAEILKDQTTTVDITLMPKLIAYGPVEFWESLDPSADHPSGLSLALGKAFSISASKDSSVYNDIYYNSDGFIVVSADGRNNMTRDTFFKIGSGNDLNDGVDSPIKDNTWVKSISVSERNYVFLYDQDGHYSKFQIIQENGGTPGVYASVVVKWIYNTVPESTVF